MVPRPQLQRHRPHEPDLLSEQPLTVACLAISSDELVSSRYERASLIVTSNKPFGRWGEVFGDDVVAAMIDRLVRHAEVIALEGNSYRIKDRDLGRLRTLTADDQ